MKTTVKRLWEKYPNANFVFWYGEYPIFEKKFSNAKELEHPEYNIPFEIGVNSDIEEFVDRLNSCNEINIDASFLRKELKKIVNAI